MREELLRMWPDEDAVSDCIKHEAETVDEAVFLAVHQPMRFSRRDQGAKRGTEKVFSEHELLAEFLHEKLPEGRIILPIEGSSGVGKSHVIRWIHAQLQRRADRDLRRVIRIPKGSSLKEVLRILLDGLQGPRYEELREQLTSAREKLDSELAAKHLILNIAHRLEQEGKAAAERIREGAGTEEDKVIRSFCDRRALPAIIGDSELLHSHWLTKEADGSPGVMARLAEHVTEKARGDEDTRTHQVCPDDLVLPLELSGRLNSTSERFYLNLQAGRGDRMETAARLINQVLDGAKQDLLQLGDSSLTDLFRSVREQLFLDGKELVLLVEDFAVLSGMQGALLQVMITEAFRDGRQVLCTMRSALAYTEGVAHVPETVRTRARSLWRIGDQKGNDEAIHARVVDLVGAYLNAARIGQQGLQEAFQLASSVDGWVPLVDGEDLEDEAANLVRAFGCSPAGYPLFPFNIGAIRQLTEQGSRKETALVYNPRNVINNVLTRILRERRFFEAGRFPDARLAERLLSAEVTQQVVRGVSDRREHERALTLIGCWGDQPSTIAEAASLPEAVYQAFDVPYPDWGLSAVPLPSEKVFRKLSPRAGERSKTEPSTQHYEETVDPKEQDWIDALQQWGAGGQLDQRPARELRSWLAQAMLEFGSWGLLPLKISHKLNRLQSKVYLPRSRGQGGLGPEDAFLIVLSEAELDDPSARAAVIRTLLAFVRSHGLHGSWDYPEATGDAALCASFLEQRVEHASSWLRKHHFDAEAETLPVLTEALQVGARALGVAGALSRKLSDRVAALFGDFRPIEEPPDTAWGRDLRRFGDHRTVLREYLLELVGARQGTGAAVHAVDVTALESTIHEVAKSWLVTLELEHGSRENLQVKNASSALRALRQDLPRTLRQRRKELLAWREQAASWFGEDLEKQELQEVLRDTITLARRVLPLDFDDRSARRQISKLNDLPVKATISACARLVESEEPGDVLAVLAGRPDPVVRATEALTTEFDKFLDLYTKQVTTSLEQEGDPVGETSRAVLQEVLELKEILDAIQRNRS